MSLLRLFDSGPDIEFPSSAKLLTINERLSVLYLCTSNNASSKLATTIKNQGKTYYLRQISNKLCESLYTLPGIGSSKVTYIPSSPKKVSARGFQHTKILSQMLATRLGLENLSLLSSKTERLSQASLSREDRTKNIKDAFLRSSFEAKEVLLVDDIVTTGATLFEAVKTLRVDKVVAVCLSAHPSFIQEWTGQEWT